MRLYIPIVLVLATCLSTQAQSQRSGRPLIVIPETILWNLPLPIGLAIYPNASKPADSYQASNGLRQGRAAGSFLTRFSVETIHTPFVALSSVSIINLWKGHFQIEGFNSTQYDVRFGPTGIDQPMRGPIHDQLGVNRTEDLSGMRLRFNFHKGVHRTKFAAV
jgi:hypothetical protein